MRYQYMTRKESILITAIDILEEKGIRGMTTKEIAIREGITEPAIYRHYNGKKVIILAILKRFSSYDDQIMSTVKQQNMTCIEAIYFFLTSLSEYYQGYPQVVTAMFSLDVFWYDEDSKELMKQIMKKRLDFLEEHIKIGLDQNMFIVDLSSKVLSEMIYGFLMNTTFNWKLLNNTESIKSEVLEMFESLTK